jgi:hypothetical protein
MTTVRVATSYAISQITPSYDTGDVTLIPNVLVSYFESRSLSL